MEAPKTIYYFKDGSMYKKEFNDDFLFRKSKSISITAKHLEQTTDKIIVNISHRDVVVEATKSKIKEYGDVLTFRGEVKYYYPVNLWKVVSGDIHWVSKL